MEENSEAEVIKKGDTLKRDYTSNKKLTWCYNRFDNDDDDNGDDHNDDDDDVDDDDDKSEAINIFVAAIGNQGDAQ